MNKKLLIDLQESRSHQETKGMIEMRDESERLGEEGKEVEKRDNGQQLQLEMPSHMEINSEEQPLEIELKSHHRQDEKRQRRWNVQEARAERKANKQARKYYRMHMKKQRRGGW